MDHVVCGIIRKIEDGIEKYLLVASKRDFGEYTGYYYPPGGHVEEGEDELTALCREIPEETGLEVEVANKITESPGDVPDQVTCWYECTVKGDLRPNYDELRDADYFSEEEMHNMKVWPATRAFFEEHVFSR